MQESEELFPSSHPAAPEASVTVGLRFCVTGWLG